MMLILCLHYVSAITKVGSNHMISSLNAFSDLLCSKIFWHIFGGCEMPRLY